MCINDADGRLCRIMDALMCAVESEAAGGMERVSAAEMGEAVDMIRDVAEARYWLSVAEAMADAEPMGYNPRRYASGRYAPKGRGKMGWEAPYAPDQPDPEGWDGMWGNEAAERPAGARGRYREARMGYEGKPTAENRRMMEQKADEALAETKDAIREMWGDADQSHRSKMKSDLVAFLNELK